MDIEQNTKEEIDEIDEKVTNTYLYKMTACNILIYVEFREKRNLESFIK